MRPADGALAHAEAELGGGSKLSSLRLADTVPVGGGAGPVKEALARDTVRQEMSRIVSA